MIGYLYIEVYISNMNTSGLVTAIPTALNMDTSGLVTAISTTILAIATIILVIITYFYLKETREIRKESERYRETFIKEAEKSRIEAKKPILSLQSDDIPSPEGKTLYLCNYGPVATDVTVTTRCDKSSPSSFYLYTLGTNERISVCGEWTAIEKRKGKVEIDVEFSDAERHPNSLKILFDYSTVSPLPIFIPVLQPVRVDCYRMNSTPHKN